MIEEAVCWYRKAAKQGHSTAQNNLGVMYRDGHGVVQDLVMAYVGSVRGKAALTAIQ